MSAMRKGVPPVNERLVVNDSTALWEIIQSY